MIATSEQNTSLTTLEYFQNCIQQEMTILVKKESHFLRINFEPDFLESEEPKNPDIQWSREKANKHMLKKAIWLFYQEFDRVLYESFDNPKNVFTRIIWGKFRDLQYTWRSLRREYTNQQQIAYDAKYDEERARGYMKRREKEKQQMLFLGKGDMELGRKLFVERMRQQQHEKYSKVNDVSLEMERLFAKWLESSEAREWSEGMVCTAPCQFSSNTHTKNNSRNVLNLNVNSVKGLQDTLYQLSQHSTAERLVIHITLVWDENVPFLHPTSCISSRDKIINLENYGRINVNDKLMIVGYVEKNGKHYIATPQKTYVYPLFPKKFYKLEYRNNRPSTKMRVMYHVSKSISNIHVSRHFMGQVYEMNISIAKSGADTVDIDQFYEGHFIRELKEKTLIAIDLKENEKVIQANFNRVERAIRYQRVSTRRKKSVTFQDLRKTEQITHVCELIEKNDV